ncbi:phosphoribosyltransferase [Melittangium boletus]|uniref:Phosphoribosyltransferase n=1 Tax=Melittangium boletus DSM 14713 TaxID=1294270 RepID=A0A250IGU7_9BACT|nr:phosphoribosyltransferase family protein [Melittangium boletus]ATB31054.1 phosphoribosyltransferase [Melittangium boletus DSM 14713]
MATKRAQPKGTKGKPSSHQVEKLVSIPSDLVLAPQVEAPRQPTGRDQSRSKKRIQELTWMDFDRAVQTLARSIRQSYAPQAVVGVAHGGVFVGGALSSALGVEFFPVRISRRSRDKSSSNPKLTGDMPKELKGKRVLIVDDVAASGDTLELATALALKVGAREVKNTTLICRPDGFSPDFHALSTEALVVFPWDYEEVVEDGRFDVDPDKAGA